MKILDVGCGNNKAPGAIGKVPLFLLVIAALLYTFAVDKWPVVSNDEVIDISVAWSYLHHGKFGSPMFPGVLGLDESFMLHSPLSILALIPFLKLLGLGIVQARLVSVLFGVTALLLTYLLASKLYGRSVALLSIAILSVNPLFSLTARQVRPEVYVSAFVLASTYFFVLGWQHERKWLYWLSGMSAGLSFLIHGYGLFAIIAICIIFTFRLNWRVFASLPFWCYFLGCVGPMLLYYWFWLKPNNDIFLLQAGNYFDVFSKQFWQSNILGEMTRYTYWQQTLVSLPPGLVASLLTLKQFRRNHVTLITIISFLVGFWLFMVNKSYVYLGLILPYISILLATFLSDSYHIFATRGHSALTSSPGRVFVFSVCIGWIVMQGGALSWWLLDWNRPDNDYYAFMSRVNYSLSALEDAIVIGNPGYWLGIEDRFKRRYIASHLPREELGEMPLTQFIRSGDTIVILIDDYWLDRGIAGITELPVDGGAISATRCVRLVGHVADRFYGSAGYHAGTWQTLSIFEVVPSQSSD